LKYSPGFRSSVVRKTLDGSGRSVAEVARETGVSYATVLSWIEKYRLGKLDVDDATGITPEQRNPGEKLTLLLESKTLDDDQKGEWLRQHGLHSEHLPLCEQAGRNANSIAARPCIRGADRRHERQTNRSEPEEQRTKKREQAP